jgi:tocopherol O-methyltransferase
MNRDHPSPSPDKHLSEVALHYDELDEFYREVWGEHLHHGLWLRPGQAVEEAVRQLIGLVAVETGLRAGGRICDAGSGYGATARALAARGMEVTAVTLSRRQHEYACRLPATGPHPTYIHGDWMEVELPEASFHAIIAIESTEHMTDPAAFFQKARRLLRPGGVLVVCSWLARPDYTAIERLLFVDPIRKLGRLSRLPTSIDCIAGIEAAGLHVSKYRDLTAQVKNTWPIGIRRVIQLLRSDARYRRFLLDSGAGNRDFILLLPLVWLAYRLGTMRYGMFTARKAQ